MNAMRILAAATVATAIGQGASAEEWTVGSPGGKAAIVVRLEDGRLSYSAVCGGLTVIENSPLGIVREDADLREGLSLVQAGAVEAGEEAYSKPHGKRMKVVDRWNGRVLAFRDGAGHALELHLRAFDDAVAFRYRFPEQDDQMRVVKGERTAFRLPPGTKVWAHPHDDPSGYTPAYEETWLGPLAAGTPAPRAAGWSFPLLFETPNKRWGLITEAATDGTYCGTRLGQKPEGTTYAIRFPDAGEGNSVGDVAPKSKLPWAGPWRVVIVGDSLAPIVETTVVESLNPPSLVKDESWIKPGRASWSWLFDPDSPQDATKLKAFVDLAAEMTWEYSLIDANWDIMKHGTVHDVIAHAQSKGVGITMWYNSGGPHNPVTERPRGLMDQKPIRRAEFKRLAEWGVKGVKIDFFQSDKQNVIALYHDILKDAADFKIMVDFHGCTLPRGWSRTYPHLMTLEAVQGEENYQFNKSYPEKAPKHNAILPFTRNVVGPMDMTPVMLRNNRNPRRTTAGHEMATAVVFETGWLHFAGGPEEYRELAEVPRNFLKTVPAAWDDTRFVQGEPGDLCVLARRSGDRWYLAGLEGAGTARELALKLPFLGDGSWSATVIEDGSGPGGLSDRSVELKPGATLDLAVRPRGGFVAVLSRKP
ncbi:glycoside hydrolase family 97 protein [Paludisphaera rhizosphaerae]|uniref:glycoside hydrolase family 97 protein n=1 Tax=Paludisphaera rhizosphaerae TaxID=2711216 RepID=UPI0013ED6AC3|nr:glycoside hydrolase family 97 protein [Paludisphaera rhizosphaerae]